MENTNPTTGSTTTIDLHHTNPYFYRALSRSHEHTAFRPRTNSSLPISTFIAHTGAAEPLETWYRRAKEQIWDQQDEIAELRAEIKALRDGCLDELRIILDGSRVLEAQNERYRKEIEEAEEQNERYQKQINEARELMPTLVRQIGDAYRERSEAIRERNAAIKDSEEWAEVRWRDRYPGSEGLLETIADLREENEELHDEAGRITVEREREKKRREEAEMEVMRLQWQVQEARREQSEAKAKLETREREETQPKAEDDRFDVDHGVQTESTLP